MFKPKLSYANVAATLALVFSMTGGAMAAHHYLITSTKQISPKVVKALKGKTGKAGPAGPQGIPGKDGAAGKEGKEGTAGTAGTARAFAYINVTGEVSHAKGITAANVTLAGGSLYCIHGLPFTPENVIGSATFAASDKLIVSTFPGQEGACPAGTQASIATYTTGGGVERGDVEIMLN